MAFEKKIFSYIIKNFELTKKNFEEMKKLELKAQQAI
jgi:uncharacterized protein YeeX (DUF496 family)